MTQLTHDLRKELKKMPLKKILLLTIVFTIFLIFYIVITRPELLLFENKAANKKYIIMFKPETSEEVMNEIKAQVLDSGGLIYEQYTIIKGFAAEMSEPFVQILKEKSNIKAIEEDKPVHALK